jgi:hypothetical protein
MPFRRSRFCKSSEARKIVLKISFTSAGPKGPEDEEVRLCSISSSRFASYPASPRARLMAAISSTIEPRLWMEARMLSFRRSISCRSSVSRESVIEHLVLES